MYSLRLAWHASGTYDGNVKNGGSDGATMRYKTEAEDPANAGLEHARTFLEPIRAKHAWISYADLWTYVLLFAQQPVFSLKQVYSQFSLYI
jgi:cytochrome c peroxidase